jgi:hypothetical protein
MESLINALKALEASTLPDSYDVINNKDTLEIKTIVSLAEEVLIGQEGQCNWDAIDKLAEQGFAVYPGDKDQFGWLTGCIETTKGVIVYG